MTQLKIAELIHEPFHYLVADFGFSLIHEENYPQDYGNAIAVLQSDRCRLRILLEREHVFVEVGSLQAPLDWTNHAPYLWFDVGDVIAFLTNDKAKWEYPVVNSDLLGIANTVDQMERIATGLRPHTDEILHVFESEVLEDQLAGLIEYRKLEADRWLKSLYQRRDVADEETEQ